MKQTTLTSFISGKPLHFLNANFLIPTSRPRADLIVAPTIGTGVNFSLVGMAYDYWLRCELGRDDPNTFMNFLGYRYCVENYRHDPEVMAQLTLHTKTFLAVFEGGSVSREELFEACLFISVFETEYRGGVAPLFFRAQSQDVQELSRIAGATNLSLFNCKEVVFNPIFGMCGSKMSIGADGDIVLGDVLVELKTAREIRLKANLRQLIGYWALNKLRAVSLEINRVGVYYPRFDFFAHYAISELMSSRQQVRVLWYFHRRLGLPSTHHLTY